MQDLDYLLQNKQVLTLEEQKKTCLSPSLIIQEYMIKKDRLRK